jgi:hypothetical protein
MGERGYVRNHDSSTSIINATCLTLSFFIYKVRIIEYALYLMKPEGISLAQCKEHIKNF